MYAPLTAIRRLMLESNRLVTIVCRRSLIKQGTGKPASDIGEKGYCRVNIGKRCHGSVYIQSLI